MPGWHAFTSKSHGGLLQVLQTSCAVCMAFDPNNPPNPLPPMVQFQAIWDTGATHSVITQPVVDACNLAPVGMVQSHGAHGIKTVPTYLVNIGLPNTVGFWGMKVGLADLPPGSHVLIGMDIISQGDFAVTNEGGVTWFSFRCPSQAHIDYVAVHQEKVRKAQFHHGGKKKGKKR